MNAEEIVAAVGKGLRNALLTNRNFLGIEQGCVVNADIRPEYLMTVKLAQELAAADHVVVPEASMKKLRNHARALARHKALGKGDKAREAAVREALNQENYDFGTERIDILVRGSSVLEPPLLLVENKLGVKNADGVIKDIDRVVTLLGMYKRAGLLDRYHIYGAVVFHAMEEQGTAISLEEFAADILRRIANHLDLLRPQHPPLKIKAGLLSDSLIQGSASAFEEDHEDGTREMIFQRDQYAFQAGLVLIGNAPDVISVRF